jgi:hypothetical protein
VTESDRARPRPPAWTHHDDVDNVHGLYSDGTPDLDEIPTATHWPAIPADDAAAEWADLRDWVEGLQQRFDHLDHHFIPACWWQHNEHVEALVALRDHEQVSFSEIAPATAPLDWFRALRDITTLLRAWTADLACDTTHQEPLTRLRPPQRDGWDEHIAADIAKREQAAIDDSL